MLHAKTINRNTADVDLDLMLEIYLGELKAYPGDVVRDHVRRWASKYFPAWVELKENIVSDRRISERRQRMMALQAFLSGTEDDEILSHRRPTQAQIERNERHFRSEPAKIYSQETLDRLAEVDCVHGDKAKAPGGKWKSVEELARQSTKAVQVLK